MWSSIDYRHIYIVGALDLEFHILEFLRTMFGQIFPGVICCFKVSGKVSIVLSIALMGKTARSRPPRCRTLPEKKPENAPERGITRSYARNAIKNATRYARRYSRWRQKICRKTWKIKPQNPRTPERVPEALPDRMRDDARHNYRMEKKNKNPRRYASWNTRLNAKADRQTNV